MNATKYIIIDTLEGRAGLGNILFSIAACFDYAKKTNRKIIFLEKNDLKTWRSPNDPPVSILFPNIKKYHVFITLGKFIDRIKCNNYKYEEIRNSSYTFVKLENYTQSPKYFENSKDEIRQLKNYLPKPDFELDYTNLAFIHIRRTDFALYPDYNTDKTNYWIKSVKDLVSKYPEVKIIILSDDLEWSNKNIPEIVGHEYNWIFLPRQTTAMETLYIMTECKIGGISANSTLSWWGCWLTPNREVYMPVPWFKSTPEDLELYYEGVNKIHI